MFRRGQEWTLDHVKHTGPIIIDKGNSSGRRPTATPAHTSNKDVNRR